jgi:hypothetical protein
LKEEYRLLVSFLRWNVESVGISKCRLEDLTTEASRSKLYFIFANQVFQKLRRILVTRKDLLDLNLVTGRGA